MKVLNFEVRRHKRLYIFPETSKEKYRECKLCNGRVENIKHELHQHIFKKHSRQFACMACDMVYSEKSEATEHLKYAHNAIQNIHNFIEEFNQIDSDGVAETRFKTCFPDNSGLSKKCSHRLRTTTVLCTFR